ncbi:hypothetical protein ACFW1A_28300 [Kitasatospora sp. NPDC058965]|uniref:hypothetical protein n=1 Tax=Kitasatospora sp. NPDC058965 TaxID=3346682 RepID=UPI0036C8CAB0
MSRTPRIALAVSAAVAVLATTGGSAAAAPRAAVQPQTVTGAVIPGGADGTPHELACPSEENVYGGGFSITPAAGERLDRIPADVVESRPNADATGWIVAVRKGEDPGGEDARTDHPRFKPADLTIRIVCTEGENDPTPGG